MNPRLDSDQGACPSAHGVLSLNLLGRPTLITGGEDLGATIKYRKGLALLGHLAVHAGVLHRRERLADLLWPALDAAAARANLRQALTNLAPVLDRADCLRRDRDTIGLVPGAALRIDLDLLSDSVLARLGDDPMATRAWREAEIEPCAAGLGGSFLDGLELPDAPEFEAWLAGWRAHFARRTGLLLARLRDAQSADGRLDDAIATARRLVRLDRLDESHATALAELLARAGDRQGALQALDETADALRLELDTAPGPAMLELRHRLAGAPARPTRPAVAPPPELRWITAMYCDAGLRHDDPRSEDPGFIDAVQSAVTLRGGTVVAAAGRGFLAAFGLDDGTERSASRALLAAIDLERRLAGAFALRIGIGAGRTLCRGGDGARHLAGDLPDIAMRIGWTADPGEVLVDETVARQAAGGFVVEAAGDRAFRGLDGVHRLFRLRGEVGAGSPPSADPEPRFVGRGAELSTLHGLWRDASAGTLRLAVIRGAPGLGKTRLGRELERWVAVQGGQVRRIACRAEIQHSPLAPVLDGLAHYTGIGAATRQRGAHLLEALGRALPSLDPAHADVLARLVDGAAGATAAGAPAGRDAVFAALSAVMEQRAAAGPTLVLVDDLHWADHATREWVGMLARVLRGHQVLLVVSTRPSGPPALPEAEATVIELGPLDAAESLALVGAASPGDAIPDHERRRIAAASAGVPLFAERLARSWADGAHHLLPIHELLQAELDALGPAKAVLRAASVLGEHFRIADLRDLAADLDVASGLERARARGMVTLVDGEAGAFAHALIRDAAYDSLPIGQRRTLHLAAARQLQAEPGHAPERVARHLDAAACWDEAASAWMAAARGALAAGYGANAMGFCEQALEAMQRAGMDPLDEAGQEARVMLGFAIQMAEGYGSARAYREFDTVATHIESGADAAAQRAPLFAALSGMFMGSSSQGTVDGQRAARRLRDLARTPAETLMASSAMGNALFWAGEFEQALDWQRRGIALADTLDTAARLGHSIDDPAVVCRAFASWTLWFRGEETAAVAMAADAVALARREQRTHMLCFALLFATGVHWFREDVAAVAALAGECLELSQRYDFALWQGASGLFLAWAQAAAGQSRDPAALFGAAAMLSRSYQAGITTSRWITARGLVALGAWREAEDLLDITVREAHLHEDQYCLPDLLWLQAACLRQRDRGDDAAQRLGQARDLALAMGCTGLLARFDAALAEVA